MFSVWSISSCILVDVFLFSLKTGREEKKINLSWDALTYSYFVAPNSFVDTCVKNPVRKFEISFTLLNLSGIHRIRSLQLISRAGVGWNNFIYETLWNLVAQTYQKKEEIVPMFEILSTLEGVRTLASKQKGFCSNCASRCLEFFNVSTFRAILICP